ncbi:MAG TPA: Uma2 family endonuclease [Thermoanaerobaculia bacterium]|nr:Uma2 family endonuclease [Thermoanaerobaculia bacterium]
MSEPTSLHRYSYRDYLELEAASNVKHEYLAGEIYAMAGGTPEHAALAVSVSSALHAQSRGGPCRVFSSDLRMRVLATGLATYPDVSVVCGEPERDPESPTTVLNPVLVVEVLSESTADYDRGEKLDHYRKVPSLGAVLLLDPRVRRIELWQRTEAAGPGWRQSGAGPGEFIVLEGLGAALDVDQIYDGASLPRPGEDLAS